MELQPEPSDFSSEFLEYDDGATVVGVCIAMIAFSVAVVSVRIWARSRKHIRLGLDDWLALLSLPLLWSLAILSICAVYYGGVGKHLAVNLMKDPDIFRKSLLCLFIAEFTYGTVIFTIKAAILVMYCRIFPTRFMKLGACALGGLTLAWWLAVIFVSIFQCSPIRKAWLPFMEEGACLDKNKFFLGNSIPNIVTDALILSLPVYEVSKLQVRRSQKVAILGMFLLGGLVVVISCIRLKVVIDLVGGGQDGDFTKLIGPCWIWTVIEPTIGLLCASLPTMQPLLYLLFSRFIAETAEEQRDNAGLVTIGGSGPKPSGKPKSRAMNGPFNPIHANDSAENPILWPASYANEQITVVEIARHSKVVQPDAIPLDSINVQKDIEWAESRQVNT
ncbi:hypothetical protein NM208_g9006 [Fusarium decemcellulare]|uniref:Uncharacterized protein n=1 Tax=Fusarium decemcellulare TaxID=57161 RepID=A0ACC1S380_9HYPO|nr:hypothetical protein NM208_g9006 [Fusarium decemcellulare]